METAYDEIQALKRIMVQKIQKAHQKELRCDERLATRDEQIAELERELRRTQDQSKQAIDDLMLELKKKDRQLLRMSQAYRQMKEDLAKSRQKYNIKSAEAASLEAEMKRNKSRVASMSESLSIATMMHDGRVEEKSRRGSAHGKYSGLDDSNSAGDQPVSSPEPKRQTTNKADNRNQLSVLKKFTGRALEWLAELEPQSTMYYMDRCQQIVPFIVNISPLPSAGAEFLLRVAHQPWDMPACLKYFHLAKSAKRDRTVSELLLIITVCARSSRQTVGGELTDALVTLKSHPEIPKSDHSAVVKTFSYLSSDRSFRKDVTDVLIKNRVTTNLSEELLRTLYLAAAQDEVYSGAQAHLFNYLAEICENSRSAKVTLERLGLTTVLKRIKLESSTTPVEIQALYKLLCEK